MVPGPDGPVQVDEAYEKNNTRTGWRMAEGAFIASLLSMTNLVMHVKANVKPKCSLQGLLVSNPLNQSMFV